MEHLNSLSSRSNLFLFSNPGRRCARHQNSPPANSVPGKLARGYQPSAHSGWILQPVLRRLRFVLGQTDKDRPLFIAFTLRKRRIRVISARDMNRKEKKVYLS